MHYTSVLLAEKHPASTTRTETSERPVKKSHFFYFFYMFSLQNCEKHLKIIAVKHRHTEMSFEGISHQYCPGGYQLPLSAFIFNNKNGFSSHKSSDTKANDLHSL